MLNKPEWLAYNPTLAAGIVVGCELSEDFCMKIAASSIDVDLDNIDRFPTMMSNFPAGTSYLTFIYFAQMLLVDDWYLYDYGDPKKNMEKYGQEIAPKVAIQDLDVPVALFSGDLDTLAPPSEVAWLSGKLGDNVVFNKQYHAAHTSFVLGNDMSYFIDDALRLIKEYNPLPF